MKNILLLTMISALTFAFYGCAPVSESTPDNSDINYSSELISNSTNTSSGSSSSQENDDSFAEGPLTEPGQWTNGSILYTEKATLLKISSDPIEQEIIPGLKITIDSVKLIKNEGLSEDFFNETGIDSSYVMDDSFYTIQVSYTISNDTDIVQDFNGIEYITTSAREQIEVTYNNFSRVEMTFQPAVDVPGNTVLSVLSPEGAADISGINIAFWSMYPEGADSLIYPSPIEINF